MNDLLKKRVFEMVSILKMPKNMKIFNPSFIDEIKNIQIANIFEKSKLILQIYNDYNKISIHI